MNDSDAHAEYYYSLGELTSGIIHEIRSPLQFIDNNLTYIEEAVISLLDGDLSQENLAYLRKELPALMNQSRQGMDQINQMISALRNLSYQNQQEQQWVHIDQAWAEARLISSREWKSICIVESGNLWKGIKVFGQFPLLVQLFINLITNGAHAIQEKGNRDGEIHLGLSENKEHLILSIEDNGVGMDHSQLSEIFKPFYTTKAMGSGSGQGLPFVKKIMEEIFKGSIQCSSEKGRGSRFILEFPHFQGTLS